MRHPIEHAEHQLKLGCLQAAAWIVGGIVYLFWPLAIGATTDASGTGHARWWAWLIEVPWLIIAITLAAVIAVRRRRR